jgi:hypothetical protein
MEKSTARSTIGREWTIVHNEHENEQIGQKKKHLGWHGTFKFQGLWSVRDSEGLTLWHTNFFAN